MLHMYVYTMIKQFCEGIKQFSHHSKQEIPCSVVIILIEALNSVENGCPIISVRKKKQYKKPPLQAVKVLI